MAGDPYWNSVVVAMHMSDTGLTDLKGHTVALLGNAARVTNASSFSGYSAGFDGAGDYLTIAHAANLDLGSGDFHIGCFFTTSALGANQTIHTKRLTNAVYAPWHLYVDATGHMVLSISITGSSSAFVSTSTLTLTAGTRYYIELIRSGTAFTAYANGTSFCSGTASGALMTNTSYIVVGGDNGANYSTAKIDDLLVTRAARPQGVPSATFAEAMVAVSGTVRDASNTLVAKPVHVHRESDGALAGITTSTGGVFSVDALDATPHYATCIFDNTTASPTIHNITPF